jgi:hypothetical protein
MNPIFTRVESDRVVGTSQGSTRAEESEGLGTLISADLSEGSDSPNRRTKSLHFVLSMCFERRISACRDQREPTLGAQAISQSWQPQISSIEEPD